MIIFIGLETYSFVTKKWWIGNEYDSLDYGDFVFNNFLYLFISIFVSAIIYQIIINDIIKEVIIVLSVLSGIILFKYSMWKIYKKYFEKSD